MADVESRVPPGPVRRQLQNRLLDGMIRKVGAPGVWKVLVVDREALRILAAGLGGLNDLVNEGVTIIEMLDMRREPLPRIPAIVFCEPSAESIQLLVNESPKQYAEFHLFFTHRVPDFQMDVLRQNAPILRKVKAFVELNVEFLAQESRVFSLDRPGASIPQLHAGTAREARDEMAVISERLTEACSLVAPDIDWTVRSDAASTAARTVATLVKEQLETVKTQSKVEKARQAEAAAAAAAEGRNLGGNTSQGQPAGDNGCVKPLRATLLILDRAADLISPIMHEFTYEAMAHDLLKLDYSKPGGAHYEMPPDADSKEPKVLVLNDEETDTTWNAVRHLFVEEARQEAQMRFKEFLETDAAYKIRGKEGSEVDIRDMSAAVRSLPESQKKADKHALHLTVLNECLKKASALKLIPLAILEQDISFGRLPDGTRARADAILEELSGFMQTNSIPLEHRIRALMIAIAVAEGTVALGGEASLLALTSVFKTKLSRSTVTDLPDLDPASSSAIRGFQKILRSARAASDAFAEKSRGGPAMEHDMDGRLGNQLKAKYVERRQIKQREKEIESRRRRHGRGPGEEIEYDVARYLPPLRSVVLDLVDEVLNEDMFPTTGAVSVDSILSSLASGDRTDDDRFQARHARQPQHRGGALRQAIHADVNALGQRLASKARSQSSGDDDDDYDRYKLADREHMFVVFFVGGATYSEVRSVHEVCAKREANLLIGGTQILTPRMFLDVCAAVADPVIRMKVMLPPLPIELAQSRAARERTMKAGMAKKAPGAEAAAPRAAALSAESPTSVHARTPKEDASSRRAPPEEEHEVVVVTEYEKKSMTKKLFGRKKR